MPPPLDFTNEKSTSIPGKKMKSDKFTQMHKAAAVSMLALAALWGGCSRLDQEAAQQLPDRDFLEIEKRLKDVPEGQKMLVDQMKPEDVIVAVNGYPLTKRFYDAVLGSIAKSMMARRNANPYEVSQRIEEMRSTYVRQFVMRRLLIDDARRQAILPADELRKRMQKHIEAVAKAARKTPGQVIKSFGDNAPVIFYDIAERTLVDALVAAKIPPLVKVDDSFVADVQAQVTADNEAIRRTNDMIRAKLAQWKADIAANKITFESIAAVRTNELRHVIEKGEEWGTFEKSEIKERALAKAAFALGQGEVSEPVEDENGFSLLKVLEITPAVKNEKGRTLQHETRKLARIFVEKEPELLRQSDNDMRKDLKQQMQLQAIYRYADLLHTNGMNKVVYPHGERLFP